MSLFSDLRVHAEFPVSILISLVHRLAVAESF